MTPQETVAHYRITAKLGHGGMGEVFRAVDTKLNREVAIKVIPRAMAEDPDRMARFEREAQVLASLNHPNIAAIYGVEERALVMELVEGETLAGPLSPWSRRCPSFTSSWPGTGDRDLPVRSLRHRGVPQAGSAPPDNGNAGHARISPEGRTLVFVAQGAVSAVRYLPLGEAPRQIASFRGGAYPFFSRDGQTLNFVAQRSVVSQPVLQIPGGGIRLGERSVLFPIVSGSRITANLAAVSRDGSRFLAISNEDDDELRTHVLSDWTTLLKP